MLVIVSDLHFVDGSCGRHNLPAQAYEKAFRIVGADIETIKPSAEALLAKGVKELKLVFLGDIFDVVRSQRWFKKDDQRDDDVRPWGTNSRTDPGSSRVVEKNREILSRVIRAAPEPKTTFDFFRTLKSELQRHGLRVEYHYVPGNHDRFMHTDPVARRAAREILCLNGKQDSPFPIRYRDEDYGVVAFHGHETDLMNFGKEPWKAGAYDQAGYSSPSIGEAITLEIASRLPMIAVRELSRGAPRQVDRIARTLKDLDNVRPVTAIFSWLAEETRGLAKNVTETLDDVVAKVFSDFSRIKFVEECSKRLDQRFIPEDVSWLKRRLACLFDKDFHEWISGIKSLRAASELLERETATSKDIYERVKEIYRHGFHSMVLERDFKSIQRKSRRRYYVYGHTHVPMAVPLVGGTTEHILINTGTFRPRFVAAGDPNAVGGFVGQRTMSLAVIFRKGERSKAGDQKHYELWSGLSAR